ncbi:zinc metalloproteinase-disintegrin-like EoMP06 [Toxorhynchites rutilus septentrionalis]|uniref:zinc metalloproteinase-disintegrin-like EoMP06 n=1 Tax=Toxorhynchites rutilus septentrionalis TaxID=329112 RepID=UPI00247A3F90|nr:zinc metalloproteinase-disintegrin-like EoMP06 [Toxorhynchites rutilus septentrionalis]
MIMMMDFATLLGTYRLSLSLIAALLTLCAATGTYVQELTHHADKGLGPAWKTTSIGGDDRVPIVPKVEHTRPDDITLTYNLPEGRPIRIDLRRSLAGRTFLERQGNRNESIVEYFEENCFYQGRIEHQPGSLVALSNCEGKIRGTVYDRGGTFYIDFDETSGGHFVQRIFEPPSHIRMKRNHPVGIAGPYNSNRHSKFVELVLVVDNSLYRKFDSDLWEVHRYCTDVVNHINMLFNPLNIFIALNGVVVWDQFDHIQVSRRADDTLNNFLQYRRKELLRKHPNDHAQLLTAVEFQDHVIGKAKLGGMCTSNSSGAVIVIHTDNIGIQAGTLAHEMGHSFNMEHDVDEECHCPDRKCIMTSTVTGRSLKHWSSCSVQQLTLAFNRGLNHCLKDRPRRVSSASCGNGFVEDGEECDCGLEEACDNICCDSKICRLKEGATCATGECCDLTTCQRKDEGTVCRSARGECDLPEFCTGNSEYCPTDVFRRNTEVCASGGAYCSDGDCKTRDGQCRVLWGPSGKASDEACYARNVNGTKYANCGYDHDTHIFRRCAEQDILCGLLFCHQLNDNQLEYGLKVFTEEQIASTLKGRDVVHCHAAFIDLGGDKQPALAPDGAPCGENRMCYQQQCWDVDSLNERGIGIHCPKNCNNRGVCNSEGNCHCDIGYAPPFCEYTGVGGSLDSGPASKGTYLALLITLAIVGLVVLTLFIAYIIVRFCKPSRCKNPLKLSKYHSPPCSRHKLIKTTSSSSAVVREISAPKLCSSTRDINGPQFTPIARLKNIRSSLADSDHYPRMDSIVSVRSTCHPSVGYITHAVPPPPSSPKRLLPQPNQRSLRGSKS